MFKIVFVDDDEAIIEGLSYLIDWQALDIKVCGKAYDGLEGIELIDSCEPNLLITDIRMPSLNGLEMIESILKKHPYLKIIILSGYDDFNYAQKAIEIGVAAYMLKPIKKQLLQNKLHQILNEIKYEQFKIVEKEHLVSKISILSEIAKEKYFIDLLNNRIPIHSNSSIDCSVLGLNEWPHSYCLLLVEYDCKESFSYDTYINSILKPLQDHTTAMAIPIQDNQVIFFIHGTSRHLAECYSFEMLRTLKHYSKYPYYIGISLIHQDSKELTLAYLEAKEALVEVFSNKETRFYKELKNISINKNLNIMPFIDAVLNSIKDMDLEGAYLSLDQFFRYLTGEGCRTTQIYAECINLFLCLKQLIYTYKINHDLMTNSDYLTITYLQRNFRTQSSLKDAVRTMIEDIIKAIENTPLSSSELLVEQVKHYLYEHYINETRESVASHFHISPVYLSRVFKSVTGTNFVDYLTQLKIDMAKTKLLNSTDQIQEISDQLGYTSAHYFTKVFEKNTGVTPTKYRKLKGAIK